MRFIVDENVPQKITTALCQEGFDVLVPPRQLEDTEIGRIAKRERRIILSFDKDFSNSLVFPPSDFHGIIRIRIHPPVVPDIMNAVEKLLASSSAADLDKKFVLLERDNFRIL